MVAPATEGAQQTPEFKPAPSELSPPDGKPYHLMVSQNCSYIYSSNIELRNFPDKESHIFMHRLEECHGKNVQVLHRCYPKQDSSLLQLFIMGKTIGTIASRTEAIIPKINRVWKFKCSGKGTTGFSTSSFIRSVRALLMPWSSTSSRSSSGMSKGSLNNLGWLQRSEQFLRIAFVVLAVTYLKKFIRSWARRGFLKLIGGGTDAGTAQASRGMSKSIGDSLLLHVRIRE